MLTNVIYCFYARFVDTAYVSYCIIAMFDCLIGVEIHFVVFYNQTLFLLNP